MAPTHKDILKRTIEALEASLRRYPENEKILHQLALAMAQLGRFDPPAFEIYQQASSYFPNDAKLQRALSIGFLVSQSNQLVEDISSLDEIDMASLGKSVDRLLQVSREYPDSPYIHRALGDMRLMRGDERDAVQHYRIAMALGIVELDLMCEFFERMTKLRRIGATAVVFFADVYQRLGQVEEAHRLYQTFSEAPRPEPKILEKFTEFLQRRLDEIPAHDVSTRARQIRQLIHVALLKNRMDEAITWARNLSPEQVAAEPRLAKDLSRRLLAMEDFRLAYDYLTRIPLDEEAKSLLNEMTILLEKRGELDSAVIILQYINKNDEFSRESRRLLQPDDNPDEIMIEVETELQIAELHWKSRRWEDAFARYLKVLELGYSDFRMLLEPLDMLIPKLKDIQLRDLIFLSDFFFKKREWRRAKDYAALALQEDPDHVQMSTRFLQSCERILLENPTDLDIRLDFGDENLRCGSYERAIQEYRKCSESAEYRMKATRRLAFATAQVGDFLGSLQRYKDLPILEREDLENLYNLSISFANAEQYREALETINMIAEYDSNFMDIQEKLHEYEEQMNRNDLGFVIDPKMRELIGDHSIGRYKYMGKIGSGGMGVVHKVLDMKTNHVVAMKILREGLSSSGKAIDRFFREARIAATLHHPNIVNILDYNISNNYGQSYIAMEFVDGPTFREIIEKKFAETVDISNDDILEVLDWSSQLCDALDATHKKGIIHRDIKPDNIMLAPEEKVKITDFGIVHIEEATFTPTGALIGTPRYMSPEQVHGGRIDSRSDIYSVGIIIYELLIGSPPFISGDISYQQVNVLPTSPREICPAIPAPVDRIIMKCLEKSPLDRYQSTLELKRDIDEVFVRMGGDPSLRQPRFNTPPPKLVSSTRERYVTPAGNSRVQSPSHQHSSPCDETLGEEMKPGPGETRELSSRDFEDMDLVESEHPTELDSDLDLA
ncbi:MAG: protein kinase [Candidatus Sumerlaeia bacterium]|nr:protein kinase [Candidatus Sumerlaeia bacterium]